MTTTLQLQSYYANLLIGQYKNQPKAYAMIKSVVAPVLMPQATIQTLTFSGVAASGSFSLLIDGNTLVIAWNDTAGTIQTAIQGLPGYSQVSVTGSIASQVLTITFTGVLNPPIDLVQITANTLLDGSSNSVLILVQETDLTLPLALQDAFNLLGNSIASGVQLDVLAKYAGVNRAYGAIVLSDSDLLTLIKFAIAQNNAGSSLGTIEDNLNKFFSGQFFVTDYKNMFMSYMFSSSVGSSNLFKVLIRERLLPAPMGVGVSLIVVPVITSFFGFSSYNGLNMFAKPFNRYGAFNTTWFFMSYAYGFV